MDTTGCRRWLGQAGWGVLLWICFGTACGGSRSPDGGPRTGDGFDELVAGADAGGVVDVVLDVTLEVSSQVANARAVALGHDSVAARLSGEIAGRPLTGVCLGCLTSGRFGVRLRGRVESLGGTPIILGFGGITDGTSNTLCAQYRETDFNFLLARGGTDLSGFTARPAMSLEVDMTVAVRPLEDVGGANAPWQVSVVFITGGSGDDSVVGMAGGFLDPAAATLPDGAATFRTTGIVSDDPTLGGHAVHVSSFGPMLLGPAQVLVPLPGSGSTAAWELLALSVLQPSR